MEMYRKFFLLTVILFSCISCTNCNYSKSIKKETRNNILRHKEFLKSFSFIGTVEEKKICNECGYSKYQVIIRIEEFELNDISFKYRAYPPYYFFTGNGICLSVNEKVYNKLNLGESIIKNKDSNNLEVDKLILPILNNSKYIWMPE